MAKRTCKDAFTKHKFLSFCNGVRLFDNRRGRIVQTCSMQNNPSSFEERRGEAGKTSFRKEQRSKLINDNEVVTLIAPVQLMNCCWRPLSCTAYIVYNFEIQNSILKFQIWNLKIQIWKFKIQFWKFKIGVLYKQGTSMITINSPQAALEVLR